VSVPVATGYVGAGRALQVVGAGGAGGGHRDPLAIASPMIAPAACGDNMLRSAPGQSRTTMTVKESGRLAPPSGSSNLPSASNPHRC